MWQPASRYPDPAVEVLDARFAPYVLFNAAVERLATGFRWSEGPVWFGDHRTLAASQSLYALYVNTQDAPGG